MHTLEEFENITNEVIKNPQGLTDITKETVKLLENSLKEDKTRVEENQELEL